MLDLTYLGFNLLVFLPVLLLSLFTSVKPHKHWRALIAGYLFVSIPFIVWDIWATTAGHWGYSSIYITSPRIFGLPIEEILFFFTVPFAMIYTWGVVKKFVLDRPVFPLISYLVFGIFGGLSLYLLITQWSNGYTRSAMLVSLLAIIIASLSRIAYSLRFWVFQIVLLGLFLIFNGILTALPIILYGSDSIIGFKVFSIPIEDFFFNFALINLFLVVFNWFDTKFTD
jgi:lycopene cyclase domain-containing protein